MSVCLYLSMMAFLVSCLAMFGALSVRRLLYRLDKAVGDYYRAHADLHVRERVELAKNKGEP